MKITPSTAFSKIYYLNAPIRVVQGGTSAGKTYSIIQYLILYSLKKKLQISIVAESIPVLKRGAYKDFIDIITSMGLYDESAHNKTDRTYHLNDSKFEFFSADDSKKLRGSRRDILFINEANNISFEAFNELNIRTKNFTFIDFNPTSSFWAHSELIGKEGVDFTILTFRDNEYLDEKIKAEIESMEAKALTSEYWANRWKVMGLGQLGIQSGSVYKDWSEIEELPDDAELLGSGIDFGFTNDPTALVSVYRYDGEIIVDEIIYQKGLLNSQLANLIKGTNAKNNIIYADSAEPKTIAELKSYGLNVLPVVKGKDSISYGIQLIQSQPIKITSRSTNLIKELQNYVWMKDKEGKDLSIPIDDFNHGLDGLRYFFLMKFGNKSGGYKTFRWRR
ncbi:PBSX family phage terminase large subunit [Flavobacterium capsici]|uniref:Terminase large subunit n=1 Tax=Flavobacterium capsici TaxID=3075618 RepID=A0AA96EU98_9FLAO|nr:MULTISPECIES: terminase large subunit [unclassified Flavobacterium]WNM18618.1 terminase large subunit [Flavobacterium sp. PMR2A8]WNM22669.1 terminase large subunit [Flavobacterium sp. PMTSA4]